MDVKDKIILHLDSAIRRGAKAITGVGLSWYTKRWVIVYIDKEPHFTVGCENGQQARETVDMLRVAIEAWEAQCTI